MIDPLRQQQLCELDESKEASAMVLALSNFFRTGLSRGEDVVTIDTEINHVKNYLVIQHMKYGDKFEYEIEIGPDIRSCRMLKLTLQPLVENALHHGIQNQAGKGTITIAGKREGGRILFEVRDTGAGMSRERLEQVHAILKSYGLADYVSFDLGMLSKYHYYTGIIFKAYTYGTGDYIVTGGRYDKLLVQFGKDTPAVGFAIVVDQVMAALSRQQIDTPVTLVNTVILYEATARDNAIRLGRYFKERGLAVQSMKRRPDKEIEDYTEP